MAIELCPKNNWANWPPPLASASASSLPSSTNVGSPRLSFSRDLAPSEDGISRERLDGALHLDSPASDFDFCITGGGPELESSTADELFYDGKILPLPLLPKSTTCTKMENPTWVPPKTRDTTAATATSVCFPVPATRQGDDARERLKEIIACPDEDIENGKPPSSSKLSSFWRFGRSASLNCGNSSNGGSHRTGLICSLSLLPRSKSAGFSPIPNPKSQRQSIIRRSSSKNSSCGTGATETKLSRKSSKGSSSSSSSSSSSASYYYGGSSHTSNGGVRISPVLNVPPPYIPKGSGGNGFFGFGYLLCNGKDKSSSMKKSQSLFTDQSS